MAEPRLASGIWVAAYRRRLEAEGIPAYVTKRGDDTAGAVVVKLDTLDGRAQVYMRSFDLETGARKWVMFVDGPEAEANLWIARQREFDMDLWVIEVESRQGRHLLDQPGLA